MKQETQTRKLENNMAKSKLCYTFGVFDFKMIKAVQGNNRTVQPNGFPLERPIDKEFAVGLC